MHPRTARVLALPLLVAGVLTTAGPAAAQPDDGRDEAAQARQVAARAASARSELAGLADKVDLAVERYDDARLRLSTATRAAATAQARVTRAEADLDNVRGQLRGIAAAAYRSGGLGDLASVMSSDPAGYLERAGTLQQIAAGRADALHTVAVARHRLDGRRQAAEQARKAAQDVARAMRDSQAEVEQSVARQRSLLSTLQDKQARLEAVARTKQARALAVARAATARRASRDAALRLAAEAGRQAQVAAAERARLQEAAQAASPVAPAAAGAAGSGASGSGSSGSAGTAAAPAPTPSSDPPPASGPPSGDRAMIAVREAERQLGKPYQWAAAGPDRFDCSGLTLWSYAKAGISLPHSSRAQFDEGRHVSRSELQPGDLVFYGSPIHHMGIYVGGGRYINAPQTGDVVKYASYDRSDYAGAVRLG